MKLTESILATKQQTTRRTASVWMLLGEGTASRIATLLADCSVVVLSIYSLPGTCIERAAHFGSSIPGRIQTIAYLVCTAPRFKSTIERIGYMYC